MMFTLPDLMSAANLVAAIGTLAAVARMAFKLIDSDKRQDRYIRESLTERRVIAQGLSACLDALIASGANGPCHDAKKALDEYLITMAHKGE